MFCCSWLCYLSSEWSFNRQRHNWRGCVPVAGFQSSATSWDSEGQRLGVQSLLRLPRLESQLRHFLAVCPRGNRFQYSMPQCSARLRQGLWSDREGKVSRYMSSKIKRVGYCYHLLGGASWTFRNTALKNNYNLWRSFYSHFCSNDHIKSLPHEENKRQSWVRQKKEHIHFMELGCEVRFSSFLLLHMRFYPLGILCVWSYGEPLDWVSSGLA